MAALALKLTDAGLAAVQGASGSDPVMISHLGLTATPFDYAPTLTALPGEFKRIDVVSGIAAAPNITHLTAYDTSADAWSCTGFGLFMSDGVLFAVYSQPTTVMSKAQLAFGLFAFDIAFQGDLAANIQYGNATFLYPPATETTRGVAKLATQAQVDAGDDAQEIVTPRTLKNRLAALLAGITGSLNALSTAMDLGLESLRARRIISGGLVTGGGDLYADRTLTVTEATPEDITAGTSASRVVTPRRLGPITMLLEQNGFIRFFGLQIVWGRFNAAANTSTAAAFSRPFETACFSVIASGVVAGGADSQDNPPAVVASTITVNGFSVFSADDTATSTCFIAVGT